MLRFTSQSVFLTGDLKLPKRKNEGVKNCSIKSITGIRFNKFFYNSGKSPVGVIYPGNACLLRNHAGDTKKL